MKSHNSINRHFSAMTVPHTIFESVCQSILHHIQTTIPGQVLMVVGPTGVGKSHLAKAVEAHLRIYSEANSEIGVTWPVRVEVPPPNKAGFARAAFYHRILTALNEPGVQRKVDFERSVQRLREGKAVKTTTAMSADRLGDIVDTALNERKPVALLIDEFGQLTRSRETRVNAASLDVIKGHANSVKTRIILFGTYEDYEKLYFTPQLGRRVRVIHFPRYRETPEDMTSFTYWWEALESRFQVPFSKPVRTDIKYVYGHSLGCMGTLLEWLRSAAIRMLDSKATVLKREHLDFARPNRLQIEAVRRTLNLESLFDEDYHGPDQGHDLFELQPKASKVPKARRRPGTRNPKRDPFGDGPVA